MTPIQFATFSPPTSSRVVLNGIHEDAVMWYVKLFMTSSATISLGSSLYLNNKKTSERPEGMSSSCKEVVNRLMKTYSTDDVIAETKIEMQVLKVWSSMTAKNYAEALWTKVLRCNQVYTEYTIKDVFVEGSSDSIGSTM